MAPVRARSTASSGPRTALESHEERRHPGELRTLQRRDQSECARWDGGERSHRPTLARGVPSPRRSEALRPRRGPSGEPGSRRGASGSGHGYEFCQPGAERRAPRVARAGAGAEGLSRPGRDRSRDRSAKIGRDAYRHRLPHGGAGPVSERLGVRHQVKRGSHLFTSESVTEGHPDKIADQISDAILDAIMAKDPLARVACETADNTGRAFVIREITSDTYGDA